MELIKFLSKISDLNWFSHVNILWFGAQKHSQDTQEQLFQMPGKGHLAFGSQENLQIFKFFKLIKNSLPHPWCQLFSMLSELLSPSASTQEKPMDIEKNIPGKWNSTTGCRIWSSQRSSMNYFSTILCWFCVCRVGVVGIRGWPLLGWWRREWWKEGGGIKLPKSKHQHKGLD